MLQALDRLVVGDARERRCDLFELGDVPPDDLQVGAAFFEATLYQEGDQALGKLHDVVERAVSNFRLDHPELGEVAACFRFLCAERRTEGVDLAERHGRGFDVELAGLREVGLLVEVVDREERGRALARGGRKDRRIGQGEAAIVEEIARGFDDFGAQTEDRGLARRADPEMAVLHEEVDAVLLGRDGVGIGLGDFLQDLHVGNVEFEAAGGALVGADFAFDDHARFLRQALEGVEGFGRDGVLGDNTLNLTAAVTEDWEQKLSALAQVIQPSANGDRLAFVLADLGDRGYRRR